jgi:hypothetical protein
MSSDVAGPGGRYLPITVVVTVAEGAAGTVRNTVTVSGGGETETGNDTATDDTPVAAGPPWTIWSTADAPSASSWQDCGNQILTKTSGVKFQTDRDGTITGIRLYQKPTMIYAMVGGGVRGVYGNPV